MNADLDRLRGAPPGRCPRSFRFGGARSVCDRIWHGTAFPSLADWVPSLSLELL